MTETRKIGKGQQPPRDTDQFLIDRVGTHSVVNGSAITGSKDAIYFLPPPYGTVEAAISAANAWAEANDVPIIYLRDIP
jgi:hypothetical protein